MNLDIKALLITIPILVTVGVMGIIFTDKISADLIQEKETIDVNYSAEEVKNCIGYRSDILIVFYRNPATSCYPMMSDLLWNHWELHFGMGSGDAYAFVKQEEFR